MTKLRFVDSFDDSDTTDPSRDLPNIREVHLDNGRTFKMKRINPYGFVVFEWDRGPVPHELSGQYTSFDNARKALTLWINNNLFAKVSETPVEKAPPIQYKKAYRDSEGKNIPQVTND